jgi:signal transduction histidine kinase
MVAQLDTDSRHRRRELERLDALFAECGLPVQSAQRERAWDVASSVLDSPSAGAATAGVALLGFATDMLVALAVELAARPAELRRLIDRLEAVGIPPVALGREMLGASRLLQLPMAVAIEVELMLLLALCRAEAVSIWTLWAGGDLRHIGHAGDFEPDARSTRQLARHLLADDSPEPHERGAPLVGVLVDRWRQPAAALIARGGAGNRSDLALLLSASVPSLTAMLERHELLERGTSSEQAVVAASERRLARLRFDLHDGPQQDVLMLAEDLRLFRSQLELTLDGHDPDARLLGRIEDLQARLVAIDGDLRRISAAVQAPFPETEPLPDALAQLADALAARTGIDTEIRLDGTLTRLTDSQHIALLGLIREALSNVREHSEAEHVTIAVHATPGDIRATVTDDGRGFDPETTLLRAAREGHLGLVGMYERVRLLGGHAEIDSRPGGPTVISVRLPTGTPVAPRHPGV